MPAFSPGVVSMLFAALCFSFGTVFIKLAGTHLPPMEILFARALVGIVYCWTLLHRQGAGLLGERKQWFLLLRGFLGFGALFCTFYAFVHLPLADATVIVFAHPIFVAVLASFILREHLGLRGIVCVMVALSGVLLVAKPSFLFGAASVLDPFAVTVATAAAVLSAFAIITVRFLSRYENPLAIIVYPALITTVLGPLLDGRNWLLPTTTELFYLLAVGLLMNMGQHFMTVAYKKERAAVISAIGYLEIPLAAIFGVLIFGDLPDMWTYVGAGLVVLGTLALGKRQS